MLIIISAFSSDEYVWQYDFAVVKIEEQMARRLSTLSKLFDETKKQESSIMALVFDQDEMEDVECLFYSNGLGVDDDEEKEVLKNIPEDIQDVMKGGASLYYSARRLRYRLASVLPKRCSCPRVSEIASKRRRVLLGSSAARLRQRSAHSRPSQRSIIKGHIDQNI